MIAKFENIYRQLHKFERVKGNSFEKFLEKE